MPRCFSSSSPSFFCVRPLLSPVWKYTGNFYHNGTFSHIFCSLGIWMLTGGVLLRGADCILPHINKHFHKSDSWRALRSDRPGSDRAQAGLRCAALKRLHGRPAIAVLMNGWTSGYWPPLRLWCMECLVLGRLMWGRKAVSYLRVEVWAWLGGSGKAFGGLECHSDRVKTAVSHYAPL